MFSDEPRSLPDWIERGYEILSSEITEGGHGEGLPRDSARDTLIGHEDFPDNPDDAEDAIDQLLNSEWLYEDGEALDHHTPEE